MWFHWEILFYFNWLLSIFVYLQLTFWSKAGSFSKDVDELAEDDNIWNDKNTEDYVRWLKKEAFDLCIQLTLFLCALNVAYIFYDKEKFEWYGPVDFNPGGLIILFLVIHRLTHIVQHLIVQVKGVN